MGANNTSKPEGSERAVTTTAIELDGAANDKLKKSQANYKGNTHFDTVEVEIIKDGSFYKKGQKDTVHPTLAAILKEKGLIKGYKGEGKAKEEVEA